MAIAALLPTSGMTISWTMLSGGNVPAAVRITVISLLLGSLLLPLYLVVMLGATVPLDLGLVFLRIGVMVLVPMLLGIVTYRRLLRRYTAEQFNRQVKPLLPAVSIWAMLYVVFFSTATRAPYLVADPGAIALGAAALLLFYLVNFALSTLTGRLFLNEADSYTLVYSTVLRNLSIALGMAATTFGPQAALLVTLAFMVQVQAAAWYGKVAAGLGLFRGTPAAPAPVRP